MINPDPRLPPHQQRVIEEHNMLKSNVDKLKTFVNSDNFGAVEAEEQLRMIEQLAVMERLARILYDRIAFFKRLAEANA